MIRVTDITLQLLERDELAYQALQNRMLNLSAYAKQIKSEVERLSYKPVKTGTIVVSLSRIAKNLPKDTTLKPQIVINDISVKTSLSLLTYTKSLDLQRKISTLHPFQISPNEIFGIVDGQNEETIVCLSSCKEKIQHHMKDKPLISLDKLSAITIRFDEIYLQIPNFLYAVLNLFASEKINIINVVATSTELSFIVNTDNMEKTLTRLNGYLKK